GLVHVGRDEYPLKPLKPLELVFDPVLLATLAAAERNRERRVAIGEPRHGIDFALGDDDLTGIARHSLPSEQDRLAIGGRGARAGTIFGLAGFRQRQLPIRQQEREDDLIAPGPDLERPHDLRRDVPDLAEIIEHLVGGRHALRLWRAGIGFLRLAVCGRTGDTKPRPCRVEGFRECPAFAGHPQVQQVAALAGCEVLPDSSLCPRQVDTERLPLFAGYRTGPPLAAFLAPARQEHFGYRLGPVGQHPLDGDNIRHGYSTVA